MAQDRMLRQSMRTSEKVNAWPIPLRYFWTQLWGYCDDWGRGRRDPRLARIRKLCDHRPGTVLPTQRRLSTSSTPHLLNVPSAGRMPHRRTTRQ